MSSVDLILRLKVACRDLCPICHRGGIPVEASDKGDFEHKTDHFIPEEPPERCYASAIWDVIADIEEEL